MGFVSSLCSCCILTIRFDMLLQETLCKCVCCAMQCSTEYCMGSTGGCFPLFVVLHGTSAGKCVPG
jgi:hypothetical protein